MKCFMLSYWWWGLMAVVSIILIQLLLGGNKSKFNLLGVVENLLPCDRIVLVTIDPNTNSNVIHEWISIEVRGSFKIKTDLIDCYIQLYCIPEEEDVNLNIIEDKYEACNFFLEGNTTLTFTGNKEDWNQMNITGGIYNLSEIKRWPLEEKLAENYIIMGEKALSLGNEKDRQDVIFEGYELIRKAKAIKERIKAEKREFVIANYDKAYSAWLILNDEEIKEFPDKYKEAYSLLSQRVKETPIGIIARNWLHNNYKSNI